MLLDEPLGGHGADAAVKPVLARLANHSSRLAWKCSGEAKARPGSKLERKKRWERSRMPLDSGSAASQIEKPTGREPQKAAKASVGLPFGAIAASRSQTTVSGRAPSFARQRPMPQRMSGACLAKISAPAPARE